MNFIQIVLFIFWLVVAFFALNKLSVFKHSGLKQSFLLGLFILKLIAGTFLILIYTYYYPDRQTADIYKYYDDAVVIHSAIYQDPSAYFGIVSGIDSESEHCKPYLDRMSNWAPHSEQWLAYAQTGDYNFFMSNRLITRIHAVLIPFSQGFIYTHGIFFNLFSMLGLVLFYRLLREKLKPNTIAWMLFCLVPSTLLWCSGLLKDCLVFSAVCIFLYALFSSKSAIKLPQRILLLLFMTAVLLYTKFYVMAALAAPVLWCLFEQNVFMQNRKRAVVVLVVFMAGLLVSPLGNKLAEVFSGKREEALKAAVFGDAKNQCFYHNIDPTVGAMVQEVPTSLYQAFCFPMPWQSNGSPFILLASLENLLPIVLLLFLLLGMNKRKVLTSLEIGLLLYVLSLAFIIGFTTPVTGGLVRYKTAFFPFALLLIANRSSLIDRLQNINAIKHLDKHITVSTNP
jgi:hypothetical protein